MAVRTLVMGAAVGYERERIAPFLKSLRIAGYDGDVLLLVGRRLARAAVGDPLFDRVRLVVVPQWAPVRFGLNRRGRRWAFRAWRLANVLAWSLLRPLVARGVVPVELISWLLPPTESRYLVFRECLRGTRYERVLLCDVRDVLFQQAPFGALPREGLFVSMEEPSLVLGDEPHNSGWIRAAYGEQVLEQMRSCRISCSGVTAGSGTAVTRYVERMARAIVGLPLRAVGASGVDQGIHNYLLWSGALGAVVRLEPLHSPIVNLGALRTAPRTDASGRLLNADGSVIAVVHQYDRLPAIAASLQRALLA